MECPDCNRKLSLSDFELIVVYGDVEIKSKCSNCSREDKYYVPADYYFGEKE